ncbi:tether containing UBX domain for GLUT4 [Gouania willdenowi]|uniref:UBX domain-containing protein n=1 Tax=Gouania willdenowi TaxID=441366 RepID=A0A8C5EA51_GOUWI|nr:tether containing UBX domain for GLUT4 [Gouania willdenowi]
MASSGSAVMVLTPNGRRQTIKVSPNTPLLQVLEDVCRKHGFNPEDHGLKFQRSILDLTLPWRFANLPNNAKLEMVTSTRKQADSQIRIALQMEDGSRLQDSFSSGQSLWELLRHFPQISPSELSASGSTPVCVYMRDEVCGQDALQKATLKSLGLTGGSAIIRFLFKKEKTPEEEEEKVEDLTETAPLPTPPVAKETTTTTSSQSDPSHSETSTIEVQSLSLDATMETSQTPTCVTAKNKLPVQHDCDPSPQNAVRPKIKSAKLETSGEDGEQAGPSGLNCHPSSTAPSPPFIPFSGGGQRLGGPEGGQAAGGSSSPSLSTLSAAVESPKAKKAKSSCSSNSKYKHTAISPGEDFNFGEKFTEPVEREPLIYHLDTISHQSGVHGDLPDEFFEVTVDDVRKRFAQLKSERKSLEEASLMTKSLRESQIMEKLNRYPKVVLRVQFPDRCVLQGFFRPLETVDAVRHFVRSHLEDPQLSFHLFITPPKTILDNHTATLFQANLFPGALVYFGSDEKTDFYIKREMLDSSVTALQANETIASCILQPTPPCSSADKDELMLSSESPSDASDSTQDEKPLSARAHNDKPERSDLGKLPKWLKLPGKK